MEAIGALIQTLAELVIGLFILLMQFVSWLLSALFSAGFLASRGPTLSKVAFGLALVLAIYLVLALARGFVPALANPVWAWAFGMWPVLGALLALIVLLCVPPALKPAEPLYPGQTTAAPPTDLISVLIMVILLGGFSLWADLTRAPTMQERFCNRLVVLVGASAEMTSDERARLKEHMAQATDWITGLVPDTVSDAVSEEARALRARLADKTQAQRDALRACLKTDLERSPS